MFRFTALLPPRGDRGDVGEHPLLLRLVRPWSKFDEAMQRNFHPGTLLLTRAHKIRVNTPQHRLVRDDENVLRPLQLHDDGFQPDDDVTVALAAEVAVVVFILVTGLEVRGIALFDFGVGQPVADPGVEFIQCFPGELLVREIAGRLGRAFERRRPDGEGEVACGFLDQGGQDVGVLLSSGGEVGVAADFAGEVVQGFAVLG